MINRVDMNKFNYNKYLYSKVQTPSPFNNLRHNVVSSSNIQVESSSNKQYVSPKAIAVVSAITLGTIGIVHLGIKNISKIFKGQTLNKIKQQL